MYMHIYMYVYVSVCMHICLKVSGWKWSKLKDRQSGSEPRPLFGAREQPFSGPSNIRRYFVTPQESGELCLLSGLLGENRDIFFPKLSENLHLITFAEIAKKYLKDLGYEAFECKTEDEAREFIKTFPIEKKWPCLFSKSDTTGEKNFEEFFMFHDKSQYYLD